MSGNGRGPKGVRTWIHLGANRRREPPRVDALKRFVTALRHYREWSPALDSELGWVISTSAKRERSAHSAPGAPYQALRLSCS